MTKLGGRPEGPDVYRVKGYYVYHETQQWVIGMWTYGSLLEALEWIRTSGA